MARIYLASSWRNDQQPALVEELRMAGHEVYDFRNPFNGVPGFAWSEIDPEWKTWRAEDYRNLLLTSPIAARGYTSDMRGMEWADTCVLLLPCGRSAHLEAGWFCGRGKRCIILTRDGEEPELMALMATEICVSVEDLLDTLNPGKTTRGFYSSKASEATPPAADFLTPGSTALRPPEATFLTAGVDIHGAVSALSKVGCGH